MKKNNMTAEEADKWLFENIWSNPLMRMTKIGEAAYQDTLKKQNGKIPKQSP